MGGGNGGGIFGFAKSKAKLFDKKSIDVTYNDVAGLDNAKKELREIVDYLKDPSKFQKLGGELPKGILLMGPPGVGKTLMAQATAGEAEVPFYSISGSEFIEMFVGVGASRVRDMFKKAKKDAPAIIFIDELDSIGRVRGTGLGGGHDEREQTLNQILAEMDGFAPHQAIVVIAATNRPDVLDPALIRPGRFDRRITLDLPQKIARREILKTHARKVPLADDVDLENLAGRTVGLSGDDLKKATQLARRMVCQWGMSEKLGPVAFKLGEPHPFLGRELTEPKDFSEHTARLIDEEIQRIVTQMHQQAEQTLSTNRNKLDALAEQLLKHETLTKDEVDNILEGAEQTDN